MTTSLTIDVDELKRLNEYVLSKNLNRIPVKSEHEWLRIKDGSISIIVYKSGKIVHNESPESWRVLESILKKEKEFEYILGSDETGKGEWYGPLVVEAVALTPSQIIEFRRLGVRDSKTITKSKLIEIAEKLMKKKFPRENRILSPEKYNALFSEFKKEGKSLNDMMAWAHAEAIKDLLLEEIENKKTRVIIDKFDVKKTESRLRGEMRLRKIPDDNVEVIQKSKGESEIPVAAASIIAKYIFEKEVDKLNYKYGVDLRNSEPSEIDPKTLPYVAKIHFKNVSKHLT